ncbi:MAG: helix-turn-helix transcriptional regulator [Patescibacteria group bacterium]|nr:helix-turn-helix transcriptional regulator [Patescibacteria group bacterium]
MNKERFLKQFGKRIAEVRKERNLTQEELAELVNVHRTYIGFIEQGKRNPVIANIYKISKALNVSLKDLFSTFED